MTTSKAPSESGTQEKESKRAQKSDGQENNVTGTNKAN